MVDLAVEKPRPTILIPPVIAKALIEIQKTLQPMIKSAENDAYQSSYVPLEDVTKKAHEVLSAHGVGVTQSPITDEQGHSALETMLFTASGQSFIRVTKLAMIKVDPQSHGSAITYTRRYALMAMLGLTGVGDDDDANKATGVMIPARIDQIEQVRVLLSLIPWPKEAIDKTVRALRTSDAADLAIEKYQRITSEIKRDHEAIDNVTKISIGNGEPTNGVLDESSPQATLQAGITSLGLKNKMMEKKFVYAMTGKTTLAKVVDPSDLKALSNAIDAVASNKHPLPAEYYSDKGEHIVDEPVA